MGVYEERNVAKMGARLGSWINPHLSHSTPRHPQTSKKGSKRRSPPLIFHLHCAAFSPSSPLWGRTPLPPVCRAIEREPVGEKVRPLPGKWESKGEKGDAVVSTAPARGRHHAWNAFCLEGHPAAQPEPFRFRMKFSFLAGIILLLALSADGPAAPPVLDWQTRGVGGGGALFAPSFSPHDANEVWMACDMSELFCSKNLGASWRMIPFRRLQGNRESCVQFTSDPQIVFTIDCTSDLRRPSKSTNGGRTWTALPTDPTDSEAYGLWADHTSTQRLIVSGYQAIYFSSNGGSTWSTAYSTNSGDGVRVAGVFWDGTDIAIGTSVGVVTSANSGTSFSVSTFTGIPAGQTILSFAGGRTGTTRRLVCATAPMTVYNGQAIEDFYGELGSAAPTVYTLDWGTSTVWQLRNSGMTAAHKIPWVGMAKNDASVLWAAGENGGEIPVVYRSTNGGTSWTSVLSTTNNLNATTGWAGHGGDRGWSYGGAPVGFTVAPTDATKAAFTDYGFCHLTINSGTSWRQTYVNPADQNAAGVATPTGRSYRSIGMENTTCWQVLFPTSTRMLLCNSDIRGSKSDDAGFSWNFNYTGHTENTMYRVLKHSNGSLYAATSSVHDLYQSTYLQDARIDGGSGRVLVSTNDGASWTVLKNFSKPVIWVASDPGNANRLYAAVVHWNGGSSPQGGIWRTDNLNAGAGATWVKCAEPPRTEGHPYNIVVLNDGALVVSYCARRTSSAFTASSGVYYSTNQGTTWTDRSHANMQYWTKDVVIDPHDPTQNTWYACVFNGWGGPANNRGGVYRTTNRGQAWTQLFSNDDVASALANVESLTVHPTTPGTAYMTTESEGLWYTSNLGATPPTWEPVPGYEFRQPTRVFFDPANAAKIWVTSFGHGLCVGQTPLASWKELKFGTQSTNADLAGDFADPDHDGVTNIVEYTQNLEPLVPDARPLPAAGAAGLPVLEMNGGTWRYLFLRRTVPGPGVPYLAEYSPDLVTWFPLPGSPQVSTVDDAWERLSWPLPASTGKIFCRLRVK